MRAAWWASQPTRPRIREEVQRPSAPPGGPREAAGPDGLDAVEGGAITRRSSVPGRTRVAAGAEASARSASGGTTLRRTLAFGASELSELTVQVPERIRS